MRRGQAGAFSVVAAVILVGVVLVVALALDTARFYLERQRLQTQADAAALAAVRELAAHPDATGLFSAVSGSALQAAQQNGYQGDLAADDAVTLGHRMQTATQNLFAAGYNEEGIYNAVQIRARKEVPRSVVAPALLPGSVPLTAIGVARQEAIGQIQVGSFLVRADLADSALLEPILGGLLGADVTLLGYDKLVGAQLRLGDLMAALGADTVDELLGANLSLKDFLRLSADALRLGGNELAAVQLNGYANAVANPLPIRLRDLLAITSDDSAVLGAKLDAFSLLMASAELANRDRQISNIGVDVGALGLSGIGGLKLDLKVREAAQWVVGPPGRNPFTGEWRTKARNSQVDLTLHLSLVGIGLVDIKVNAAGASAWLKSISPAQPSGSDIPRSSADLGAATEPASLSLSVLGVASVSGTTSAMAQESLAYTGPFPNTRTVGTQWGSALAELVHSLRIKVLGLSLPLPGADLLAGVLTPVGDKVLTPVLQQLGVQLGGADVTVIYLDAGEPRLML